MCAVLIKLTRYILCSLLLLTLYGKGAASGQELAINGSIGHFNMASGFCINELGEIYVTQAYDAKILKIDSTGTVLQEAGGFGWDAGLFDNPVSIAPGLLRLYVADRNNHRVQVFGRDLALTSIISEVSGNPVSTSIRYPGSVCVNKKGELFILNGESKSIVKCAANGEPVQKFADLNDGVYQLINPLFIFAAAENGIVAADENRCLFFDSYGNGLHVQNVPEPLIAGCFADNKYFYLSKHTVFTCKPNGETVAVQLPKELDDKVIAVTMYKKILYCLTTETIYLCRFND